MATELIRTNVMLPKRLIKELDRKTRNRSEYMRRMLEKSLAKEKYDVSKMIAAIEKARGAWADNKEGLKIIRELRKKDRQRDYQTLKNLLKS